jgi:DNA repair protein RecO (recombination protein O)
MTTNAWLLHQRASGDTSSILRFLTLDNGLMTVMYKGGRTQKKQMIVKPFSLLWLSVNIKKEWYYVHHLESIAIPCDLKGIALFAGLYLNELLCYVLRPLDPYPAVYHCYNDTIHALAMVDSRLAIEALLRRFEWVLLKEGGYCLTAIESVSDKPIVANHYYQFIPSKGFINASSSNAILGTHIMAIVDGDFHDINVLKSAKKIMRQAIDYLLNGRPLKSRDLFIPTKSS